MVGLQEQATGLFDLKEKVMVVTGGCRGIGLGMARAFAAIGAHVILLDINKGACETAEKEFEQRGYSALTLLCDVSNGEEVDLVFENIISRFGRIDVLVNCAGFSLHKPAEEHTREEFDRILRVNLYGTFYCCVAAGRHMIKRKKGKIINIGSVRGQVGLYTGIAAYSASKAAVHMLTKQLATEWGKYNIHVNCIAPGLIVTPRAKQNFLPDMVHKYESHIPLGHAGNPDGPHGLVGIAIFLASSASDYVSGHILFADGGLLAGDIW